MTLHPFPAMSERLYGVPGAEEMHFDLASAYETQIEPYHDSHGNRPAAIEEWSTHLTDSHLPGADDLLEWATEWTADNAEVDEGFYDDVENGAKHPDVVAAFSAALDLWASKLTYRMANVRLRVWTITWDRDGRPLADGEPIYRRKAEAPR